MKLGQTHWLRFLRRSSIALALAILSQLTYANAEYAAAWGPAIGSKAPILSALDQDGNQQDLTSLSGSKGLLFVFNRSVDW
ncbi:MAG: hypothetical protein CMP86_10945 [Gammaproteobacteria bacterium]|jgi:hypothetical protein|nr:hypothetical protein [Gammaproteobacteria bacterium]